MNPLENNQSIEEDLPTESPCEENENVYRMLFKQIRKMVNTCLDRPLTIFLIPVIGFTFIASDEIWKSMLEERNIDRALLLNIFMNGTFFSALCFLIYLQRRKKE